MEVIAKMQKRRGFGVGGGLECEMVNVKMQKKNRGWGLGQVDLCERRIEVIVKILKQ